MFSQIIFKIKGNISIKTFPNLSVLKLSSHFLLKFTQNFRIIISSNYSQSLLKIYSKISECPTHLPVGRRSATKVFYYALNFNLHLLAIIYIHASGSCTVQRIFLQPFECKYKKRPASQRPLYIKKHKEKRFLCKKKN